MTGVCVKKKYKYIIYIKKNKNTFFGQLKNNFTCHVLHNVHFSYDYLVHCFELKSDAETFIQHAER